MKLVGHKAKVEACFGPLVQKFFWTHLMVLLGDESLVDAQFGLFGDRAHLDAR
jgi:hypothetical protein